MGEHDNVSRDQHRADLAELRLELSGTLASLDKRTELMAQDLGALRRETGEWRDSLRGELIGLRTDVRGEIAELRAEMRAFRTTTQRQLWVMVGVVAFAVLTGVIKLVLLP